MTPDCWNEGQSHDFIGDKCIRCGAPADPPCGNMDNLRRVVCAAIRAADGSLLLGIRHYSRDMREQIGARRDGVKFLHRHDEDQGFVDQHGVWMSRHEAYYVATEAGQIMRGECCGHDLDGPKLYSEGLY